MACCLAWRSHINEGIHGHRLPLAAGHAALAAARRRCIQRCAIDRKEQRRDTRSSRRRRGPCLRTAAMSTLSLVYWLAGGFAFGLFVYLGYALLRPEQF